MRGSQGPAEDISKIVKFTRSLARALKDEQDRIFKDLSDDLYADDGIWQAIVDKRRLLRSRLKSEFGLKVRDLRRRPRQLPHPPLTSEKKELAEATLERWFRYEFAFEMIWRAVEDAGKEGKDPRGVAVAALRQASKQIPELVFSWNWVAPSQPDATQHEQRNKTALMLYSGWVIAGIKLETGKWLTRELETYNNNDPTAALLELAPGAVLLAHEERQSRQPPTGAGSVTCEVEKQLGLYLVGHRQAEDAPEEVSLEFASNLESDGFSADDFAVQEWVRESLIEHGLSTRAAATLSQELSASSDYNPDELLKAVGGLSPLQLAVSDAMLKGKTEKEIVEELGVSRDNVHVAWMRAKDKLSQAQDVPL